MDQTEVLLLTSLAPYRWATPANCGIGPVSALIELECHNIVCTKRSVSLGLVQKIRHKRNDSSLDFVQEVAQGSIVSVSIMEGFCLDISAIITVRQRLVSVMSGFEMNLSKRVGVRITF